MRKQKQPPSHNRGVALERLIAELEDLNPAEPTAEARRCLLLLAQPGTCVPFEPSPTVCPNCGEPCDNLRSPYCGDDCRLEAALVRQLRNGLVEGQAFVPERQLGMGQALWHLLGGGYPYRQTLATKSTIAQAMKRTGGRCEVCGEEATTFDHVGSG